MGLILSSGEVHRWDRQRCLKLGHSVGVWKLLIVWIFLWGFETIFFSLFWSDNKKGSP